MALTFSSDCEICKKLCTIMIKWNEVLVNDRAKLGMDSADLQN